MNDPERLANLYQRALDGGAWHGSSLREVLARVDARTALAHPVPGAHSIAEIALHTSTWHEVVRLRLLGESPEVSAARDWPSATFTDETAWQALRARLFETGHALRAAIAAFPPERLHERRPGLDDTWFGLIAGELQHILYHAGQIPILQKAGSERA